MTIKGMEYKDKTGDDELIRKLIADDQWWFQQKFDGTRTMINLSTLEATQRNSKPLKHTAATQWLPSIRRELKELGYFHPGSPLILDCELIIETGRLYVFDVIDTDNLNRPMQTRLRMLEDLPTLDGPSHLRTVYTAWTAGQKKKLLDDCRDKEGVVAKKITAPYQSGIRTPDVLKLKNTHTAELVVMSLSESPLSAGLGIIHSNGDGVTISRASMIGKDPSIRVGDVVEVNYLAWTGASLLQPRIIRKRYDKDALACTMSQFAPYSREAVR